MSVDAGKKIQRESTSRWVITLFSVKGIPVRVHFTFLLFVAYLAAIDGGNDLASIALRLCLILTLFGCVLLHELGHALTARYYGIGTRDIVLYPFGGIATVVGNAAPRAEFFIAAAGPLVNVVIAGLCLPMLSIFEPGQSPSAVAFLDNLYLSNLILALFNLVPAFPMDGGRMLRAALSVLGFGRATLIATRLSQGTSLLMALFALYTGNVILVLISVLVFTTATQEQLNDRTRDIAADFVAADVMTEISKLVVFAHGTTVSQALSQALKSLQSYFPVVHADQLLGVVHRDSLLQVGATDVDEAYISGLMDRDVIRVDARTPLKEIVELFRSQSCEVLMVTSQSTLVGMILKDRLLEYLLVYDFRRRSKERAARDEDSTENEPS